MPFDMEMDEFHDSIESKKKYFDKFKDMEPYFNIQNGMIGYSIIFSILGSMVSILVPDFF